jgi:hypothetical protein
VIVTLGTSKWALHLRLDHRRALAVYLVPRGQPIQFYVWHCDLLSALPAPLSE